MLRGQVQIVADGDKRIAKVGDKALKDFVKNGRLVTRASTSYRRQAMPGAGLLVVAAAAGKTMARAAFDALGQESGRRSSVKAAS